MEQMADIPGVSPEDMADFNADMAAQVAQVAPETAGEVLGAMAAADPGAAAELATAMAEANPAAAGEAMAGLAEAAPELVADVAGAVAKLHQNYQEHWLLELHRVTQRLPLKPLLH